MNQAVGWEHLKGSELSDAALAAGRRLLIDQVTREIALSFRAAAIPHILLKGPSVAHWLYVAPSERTYVDTDVLVPPEDRDAAEEVLARSGFAKDSSDLPLNRPRVSSEWVRPKDGAAVDLHVGIEGVGADLRATWDVLWSSAAGMTVLDIEIPVLAPAARAMHLALHAAHHGPGVEQGISDLRRGVVHLPIELWVAAAGLARELGALTALTTGLRLIPEGRSLAHRLGLVDAPSVEVVLFSASLPHEELSFALGFEWLASRRGFAAKARYVAMKLFPPRSWMRQKVLSDGQAHPPLILSYLRRWIWLGAHVWPGFVAWNRARKQAQASR